MPRRIASFVAFAALSFCSGIDGAPPSGTTEPDGTSLAVNYAHEIDRRLEIPEDQQQARGRLLVGLFSDRDLASQYVVLVDRSPFVQAVAVYWVGSDRNFHFIGASPASTDKPGSFDHFITPTGIFEHTIGNPDFRAEGTRNENGIRGYGRKGMRVSTLGGSRRSAAGGTAAKQQCVCRCTPQTQTSSNPVSGPFNPKAVFEYPRLSRFHRLLCDSRCGRRGGDDNRSDVLGFVKRT